jgi:hypothetical protein
VSLSRDVDVERKVPIKRPAGRLIMLSGDERAGAVVMQFNGGSRNFSLVEMGAPVEGT